MSYEYYAVFEEGEFGEPYPVNYFWNGFDANGDPIVEKLQPASGWWQDPRGEMNDFVDLYDDPWPGIYERWGL